MDKIDLDEINNSRVEESKKRIAEAIKILDFPSESLNNNHLTDDCLKNIARAVNLLEVSSENMKFACEHFEWDNTICDDIDNACGSIGRGMSIIVMDKDEDYDLKLAGMYVNEGINALGKILASLIRWNDDDEV